MKPFFKPYRHDRPPSRHVGVWSMFIVVCLVVASGLAYGFMNTLRPPRPTQPTPAKIVTQAAGDVIGVEGERVFTAEQSFQTAAENYGPQTLAAKSGVRKVTFLYRSTALDGSLITVYGRAYVPTVAGRYPVFAFAPGTTGIGDQCAASLEQPKVVNWGNYDSHMIAYASQGYVAVTTDYEGMRDGSRIHHYMVGELEGRALLDAVRAVRKLAASKAVASDLVVLGGYSQGGHAAFWADSIAASYARDVQVAGVVGFGPVMSVKQSIGDVAYGSSLNWFGPYVLQSYGDLYARDYNLSTILQPRYAQTLANDVLSHCIDTDIAYGGHNPSAVYTPAFLASVNTDTFATDYPVLAADLDKNATGNAPTASAKLINQGRFDNVILPRQQEAVMPGMCSSSTGPARLKLYGATHYNTMVMSFHDTLDWMDLLRRDERPVSTCPVP